MAKVPFRGPLAERVVRALCEDCNPHHVLDNGRVWGFCGARKLMRLPRGKRISEHEVATVIKGSTGVLKAVEGGKK